MFCILLNKKLRASTSNERKEYSKVMNSVSEIYDGVSTIKLYGRENYFSELYKKTSFSHSKFLIKFQNWKSLGQSAVGTIFGLMPLVALILGIYMLLKGKVTVGVIVSFYAYLPNLSEPIRNLTDYNIEKQRSSILEERIFELIPKKDEQEKNMIAIDKIDEISFENVKFSYDDKKIILNDLSFDLKKGSRMAISGQSGVGKSTLLKILLRQIENNQGNIFVDKQNIKSINEKSYISRISVLPQEVFTFYASITDNICMGEKYDEKMIDNIIDTARLKHLYGKDVDVKGLSGGEKQRLGIARALLNTADILILDEPTSALDVETEKIIVENLDKYLKKNSMSLITISHRPEILKICDMHLELFENGAYKLNNL